MVKVYIISFIFLPLLMFGQYTSGIVKYGIEFNKESYEKKFNQKDRPLTLAESFIKRYRDIHRKFFSQDIVFIELEFNGYSYSSKPTEVMVPESITKKHSGLIRRNDMVYGNLDDCVFLFKTQTTKGDFIVNNKKNYSWEIYDEYKTIAGYKCRKAKMKFDDNPDKILSLEVWFTPQIPVAFSPVRYRGLPGAVLGFKNYMHYIYAKEIEFKDNVSIKKPEDGKKISFEEYMEMITRFKPD